jgi:hypothetical protein
MLKTYCLTMTIWLCAIALPNQLAAIETIPTETIPTETRLTGTKSLSLNIEADSDQNLGLGFESFLQQAQTLANQAIQTEFNNSSDLQRLNITVSLSRRGMVAPILIGTIERSQQNSQTWSRQIARSAELLGYVTISPIAKRSPVVNAVQPSVYSAGFFKINRPLNRQFNQSIPANSANPIPNGFPSNFSSNSRPQTRQIAPQNIIPANSNNVRDD